MEGEVGLPHSIDQLPAEADWLHGYTHPRGRWLSQERARATGSRLAFEPPILDSLEEENLLTQLLDRTLCI